jgi:L-arabinose isomerase
MDFLEPIKSVQRGRVGLYAIGHPQYWVQFPGLRERLTGYNDFIAKRMQAWGDVVNYGMVDTEEKAHQAGEYFNAHNVDILVCYAATYALSATNIAVPQICRRPVLLLNLQPALRMDYAHTTTGEWLAHCCACCVPENANAYTRAAISFHLVSGLLGLEATPEISVADEATEKHPAALAAWREIEEWVRSAGVKRTLQYGRIGFLGHTYPGMLDMYSDFTMITAQTGLHMELLEMCDLARFVKEVTSDEKQHKMEEIKNFFTISEDSPADPLARRPTTEQLDWSCTVACAQERMVREFNLDGLTYYYRGYDGNEYEHLQEAFILGHSLLTGRGIPCAGEGDLKTCIAMKICDILNIGGSYCEIVASDFVEETIIMGHDGPFHIGISSGKPCLRGMGLYHGKWGSGISVEAKVQSGPITNLGITQTRDGRLYAICNQGEATQGPILQIGNTMTPVRFAKPPSQFMNEWFALGPTHHFAMSIGHNYSLMQKICALLDWPIASIC